MKKAIKIDSKYIFIALIATLVLCFVFLLFSSPDNESEEAMTEISDLTNAIHDKFQKKPDYWGLNSEYVINNSLFDEKKIKDNKLVSVLGNEILVGSDNSGAVAMPGTQSFNIVYKNISRKDCVILSSYNLDYAEKIGLLSITIINSKGEKAFSWGGNEALPISVSTAKDNCFSSENTIVWTFK